MYQLLKNLRQGAQSMEDYIMTFYQLLSRNEVHETEDQLVTRFIGSLREQIQETVNLFDSILGSAAH